MKISKNLLKAIAASVVIGGAVTSCVTDTETIKPETVCEEDGKVSLKEEMTRKAIGTHVDNCPACGMG
jgi:hypothetical protein